MAFEEQLWLSIVVPTLEDPLVAVLELLQEEPVQWEWVPPLLFEAVAQSMFSDNAVVVDEPFGLAHASVLEADDAYCRLVVGDKGIASEDSGQQQALVWHTEYR